MDFKINGIGGTLNAILFLAAQNNIALRTLSQTLVEYVADKEGENRANEILAQMNASNKENQEVLLALLKANFDDLDDITLDDLFGDSK